MKSFCRGHYLNENVKIVDNCFCIDYHYNFISRVPAKKGYKPKRIMRAINTMKICNKRFKVVYDSIVDHVDLNILKACDPNKKYIIWVMNKGSYPTHSVIIEVEEARRMGLL